VDGSIVPLTTQLANGQRIEIITTKQGGPSRDWLSAAQGYVASARAKAKIRHWFKYQHFDENVSQGRDALEKEAHRLGLTLPNLESSRGSISTRARFSRRHRAGDLTARQAVAALQDPLPRPRRKKRSGSRDALSARNCRAASWWRTSAICSR
jgi:GTP pyrophosphokinase